jgi:hypothetical protein
VCDHSRGAADPKEIDMSKNDRGRCFVARPYVAEGVKRSNAWTGVPGARHIPDSKDPAFARFAFIASEWVAAGVEMTDDVMAAVAKLAEHQLQRERQRDAAKAQQTERAATSTAAFTPAPGEFGDSPGGHVYYIRRGPFVKIGTTTKLRTRMRDLMPDEILAVEPGSYTLERTLHARFAADRIAPDCEYFRLTDELRDHVEQVAARCGPPPKGLSQLKNYQ